MIWCGWDLALGNRELLNERFMGVGQFLEKGRAGGNKKLSWLGAAGYWGEVLLPDGEEVATGKLLYLPNVPEGGTHDDGRVVEVAEVVVNLPDGGHTRVVLRGDGLATSLGDVPVEDTPHEGGDEGHSGLGAGHSLGKAKEESEVAVDAMIPLETLGRLYAFPSRGDLDEDAALVNIPGLVQLYDVDGLPDRGLSVKRQPRIHLGGHSSRHNLEDLGSKVHQLERDRRERLKGEEGLFVCLFVCLGPFFRVRNG